MRDFTQGLAQHQTGLGRQGIDPPAADLSGQGQEILVGQITPEAEPESALSGRRSVARAGIAAGLAQRRDHVVAKTHGSRPIHPFDLHRGTRLETSGSGDDRGAPVRLGDDLSLGRDRRHLGFRLTHWTERVWSWTKPPALAVATSCWVARRPISVDCGGAIDRSSARAGRDRDDSHPPSADPIPGIENASRLAMRIATMRWDDESTVHQSLLRHVGDRGVAHRWVSEGRQVRPVRWEASGPHDSVRWSVRGAQASPRLPRSINNNATLTGFSRKVKQFLTICSMWVIALDLR